MSESMKVEAYLAGEVVHSPEPRLLEVIDPSLVALLKLGDPGQDYTDISGWSLFDGHRHKVKPVWPDLPGYRQITQEFCGIVGKDRLDITERYGWYRKRSGWFRYGGSGEPHIDGLYGFNCNFIAARLIILAIGVQTTVWAGKIQRRNENNETSVSLVDAKKVDLTEGGVYQLDPLTAHAEPKPPLLISRRRYFWRSAHHP
jgi:hypothetical protein